MLYDITVYSYRYTLSVYIIRFLIYTLIPLQYSLLHSTAYLLHHTTSQPCNDSRLDHHSNTPLNALEGVLESTPDYIVTSTLEYP